MTLRTATPADAAAVRAIYAPHVTEGHGSFETDVPSAEEMTARIGRTLARFPWLIAADARAVLGYAYATEHRSRAAYGWCVEVSVYVHPEAQRRGVGRALYAALHALLAAQGLVNAYAGIALPNPPSVALHEALGYTPVGVYRGVGFKAGAWRDVGWWHRLLTAPPSDPAWPVPFAALPAETVERALARSSWEAR